MGCHKMKPLVRARTQPMESGRDNRQKRNRTDQFLEKIDDRNNRPAKKQRTQVSQKVSMEPMIDVFVFTVKWCKKRRISSLFTARKYHSKYRCQWDRQESREYSRIWRSGSTTSRTPPIWVYWETTDSGRGDLGSQGTSGGA